MEPKSSRSGLGVLVTAYMAARAGELSAATRPAYRGRLSRFATHAGPRTAPDDVTRSQVEGFLRRADLQPWSRKAELSTVRGFWAWLLVEGHASKDPTVGIPKVRVPRRVPRAVRADAVARLLDVCPDQRATLVCLLMVQEGLRCVEVAGLEMGDVVFDARTLLVRGKGSHERVLPVSDETWEALGAYLADCPATSGPLVRSKVRPQMGVTAQHVSNIVSDWFDAAGIPAGTAHKLRHSAASHMVERGVSLLDIRTALGHASVATTEQYLPLVVDDLRRAMGGRHYGPGGVLADPPVAAPTLDATGPLIDTVAALATAVARLEARLGSQSTGAAAVPSAPADARPIGGDQDLIRKMPSRPASWDQPPAPPPCPAVDWRPVEHQHNGGGSCICPHCGQIFPAQYSGRFAAAHMATPHERCRDCGRSTTRLHAHRVRSHGAAPGPVPAPPDCPWGTSHEHTGGGHCICPWCAQTSAGIHYLGVYDTAAKMATHVSRPHDQCPDCDRSFIDLAAHRRRAHPWAAQVQG